MTLALFLLLNELLAAGQLGEDKLHRFFKSR
jgi:hypothetical protein